MFSPLLSSRWWSVAALVGLVLGAGRARWPLFTAAPPQQPRAFAAAAATSAPEAEQVTIPRIHLQIALPRDSADEHERAVQPTSQQPAADARAVADGPAPAPPLQATARPEAPAGSAVRAAEAPEGPAIPELMVCHADRFGPRGAADALQECIRRAPAYSSVEVPPGVYVLERQVVVSTPLTIRTAGTRGSSVSCVTTPDLCATFIAAPDFRDPWGLLLVTSTNSVTIEHLVIDGNQGARGTSTAARACLDGRNILGFNASVLDCLECRLADVLSRNALCGTGMVWVGRNASIERSAFQANGNASARMWSDGLTVLYAPQSEIVGNQFIDNSDVALIVGYGVSSRIERNVVRQRAQPAFAGLMLHNFNSGDLRTGGDFRGAVVANNTIDCGPRLCVFGIEIGPGPWNHTFIVVGGDVHDNVVRGAKVGINVDGAGLYRAPVVVRRNVVSDVPSGTYFADCTRPIAAGDINISPTSIVNRGDDTARTGSTLSDWCQLFSNLSATESNEAEPRLVP